MKDSITTPKGYVDISIIKDDKVIEDILVSNTLVENAKQIINKCLAGENQWPIKYVKAFDVNGELAQVEHYKIEFNAVGDRVTFSFMFDEISFDGTVIELQLHSEIGGEFSHVQGLNVTKDNTSKLEIKWKLIITDP